LLKFGAWYIKQIPERKLPLTEYWQGWNPRFYVWLSGFLDQWANGPRRSSALAFWLVVAISFVFGWNIFSALFIASLFFIYAYVRSFRTAKMLYWDMYIWQAEPAAQILVGSSEEYNKLSEEDKNKVMRHIADIQIGINKGSWIVSGGKAKVINPPSGIWARFGGQGVLVVQEGHAVVTERSGNLSHIFGYGIHFLAPFETVSQVIYLGMQRGVFEFEHIITRDRIVVEKMHVIVFYKANPGRRTEKSGIYSFDRSLIVEKIWSAKSIVTEDKSANLEGGVRAVTNSVVRDTVAQYNLEDLITATGPIRMELRTKLRDSIQAVTKNAMGILTPIVDIGEIIFPITARDKLMERWKVDWQAQIDKITAETQKETKIIDAKARQEVEESEAAIARIKAETKKYETLTDAQARQEALEAETAIARARAEVKKHETITDAEARLEVEKWEAEIEKVKAEVKRDAVMAMVDAEFQEIIAKAEASRQAKIKEAEAEQAVLEHKGKGNAAAKRDAAFAEAAGEAEKLRQVAEVISNLETPMARILLLQYGNVSSRRMMQRLLRQVQRMEATDVRDIDGEDDGEEIGVSNPSPIPSPSAPNGANPS
jgi:regulator of protease activity HflC (stomatin/prohibitin superfamily)